MNKWRTVVGKRCFLIAALCVATSARSGSHEYVIDYHYTATSMVDMSRSSQQLTIGHIEDRRGGNPKTIFVRGYFEDQASVPVVDIVRDALVQGLSANKVPMSESNGSRKLSGELLDYQSRGMTKGMWEFMTEDRMTIRLVVTDETSHSAKWTDTLNIGTTVVTHGGRSADKSLRKTLDELLARLLADEDFRRSLN